MSAAAPVLHGRQVRLRPLVLADLDRIVAIRSTPAVFARWRGDDLEAEFRDDVSPANTTRVFAIEDLAGEVIGAIQWHEEVHPDYRHAGIDLYLHPDVHGRSLGPDAIRVLARHILEQQAHHRITIDPAADNVAAIRCYAKVGFREVGLMRAYERGSDGTWHDGLLMELLAADLTD